MLLATTAKLAATANEAVVYISLAGTRTSSKFSNAATAELDESVQPIGPAVLAITVS